MNKNLNKILSEKNSKLETLVGYFPKLKKEDMDKIINLKFSFVHLDFDLYQSTIDTFNFIKNRLEKNAIILFDDYNLINQEGVKKAVKDLNIDLDRGIQTQSGQLIIFI
jgi:O-methyltransferase